MVVKEALLIGPSWKKRFSVNSTQDLSSCSRTLGWLPMHRRNRPENRRSGSHSAVAHNVHCFKQRCQRFSLHRALHRQVFFREAQHRRMRSRSLCAEYPPGRSYSSLPPNSMKCVRQSLSMDLLCIAKYLQHALDLGSASSNGSRWHP